MFSSTGHSALPLPLFQAVDDSNKVLKLSKFQAINETSAKQNKANLDTLRHKTGISKKDVIHVSATFSCTYKKVWRDPGDANSTEDSINAADTPKANVLSTSAAEQPTLDEQVVAFCLGTINNIVQTNSLVPTPNP